MEEVVQYMLENHGEQIARLRNHAHEVNNSLTVINHNMDMITNSIKDTFNKIVEVSERVKTLEEELVKRQLRHSMIKGAVNYWPAGAIVVVIMAAIDYPKLMMFLKSLL